MCRKFGICLAGPYGLTKEHAYLLGSGVAQPSRASPRQAAPSPPHLIANRSPKRPRHGTERRRCRRLRFRTTPWSFAAGDPPDEFPFAPLFSSLPTVSRAPERRAAGRPVPQAAMARSSSSSSVFRAPRKRSFHFFFLFVQNQATVSKDPRIKNHWLHLFTDRFALSFSFRHYV